MGERLVENAKNRCRMSLLSPDLPGHGITTYGNSTAVRGIGITDERSEGFAEACAAGDYLLGRFNMKRQARELIRRDYERNPFFRRAVNIVRDIDKDRNS